MTIVAPPDPMPPTVLFLSEIWPWPVDSGGAQRSSNLVHELLKEYRVTVFGIGSESDVVGPAPADGLELVRVADPDVHGFSIPEWWTALPTRLWRTLTPGPPFVALGWKGRRLDSALAALRASGAIDVVWATRIWTAEAARRAGFARIILDVDDVPSVVLGRLVAIEGFYRTRWLHALELAKARRFERALSARYSAVAVCKAADIAHVGARPERVFVVPNGVSDLPPVAYGTERENELLFVGNLAYPPNADAVRYFCGKILPLIRRVRPQAELLVAGKSAPSDLASLSGCRLLGFVDPIAPVFDRVAAAVAPLRLGGGTKLKVLESVARGRATVCTPAALEGIELPDGAGVLLAHHPAQFAQACLAVMQDPDARTRIGRLGRAAVLARYRWSEIGSTARQVVRTVLTAPP